MESTQVEQAPVLDESQNNEHVMETDAIHPRFQPRTHLLFSCPNCFTTKPSESKIQRHFLKKSCFPIHSICSDCAGPVFYYKFGPKETRLSHDCAKWAEYKQKKGTTDKVADWQSETSSIADSIKTQITDSDI